MGSIQERLSHFRAARKRDLPLLHQRDRSLLEVFNDVPLIFGD